MLKSTDWTGLSATILNASDPYRHSALSSIEQSLRTAKHCAEIYEREKLLEAALGDPLSRALRQYADHQLSASSQVERLLGSHFDVRYTPHSLASALATEQTASVLWKEHIAVGGAAFRAAELAHQTRLPEILESHRNTVDVLAQQLALGGRAEYWNDTKYLSSFSAASALAELHNESFGVTRLLSEANLMMVGYDIRFSSLGEYRSLLDTAGLTLPRWPQMRLLRKSEKTARFYSRFRSFKEPRHVRKAKSLVRQYELTLREIIDELMTSEYGEDWVETRLPLCECNDLLRRWKRKGTGTALDHADYTHYARIISHPEHFAVVFSAGFEDPELALQLLLNAGRLRAASHHHRVFTVEDLRELRVTWRTIAVALVGLLDDYDSDLEPSY